jgi:predicted ATPase/DNA-binding CsgD family transcriptional regulator/transcriptional regulator with XRE-family HTH domain
MDEPRPFGQLLRHHRLAASLTQEALAERAGLSARGIADLERGVRRFPYPETVQCLAEGLQLAGAERAALLAAGRRRRPARSGVYSTDQPHRSWAALEHVSEEAPREAWDSTTGADAHTLPTPLAPLIGRTAEMAALRRRMGPSVRLLTLTGPGGTGKTRLALAFAAEKVGEFADGVRFVPLAGTHDPRHVPSAVAHQLGIREAAGLPLVPLLPEYLRGKRMLLVLDNFEHLLEAAPLLSEMVSACPDLRVLVTSRAALRVSGEYEYAVPPLALPRADQLAAPELARVGAVELFVERARAIDPRFAVTEDNAVALAAICQRLDGLPLAIELAAARSRVLSPEALLARLDNRLLLLTTDRRDLPARQRTLRATLAWSYDLLTEGEQTLFRRLAVFVDGWTLQAAETVCAVNAGERTDVLDRLEALVSRSQVQVNGRRFAMLETVREFAVEQLANSGEHDRVRERHCAFFMALAGEASHHLESPEGTTWLDVLECEHANLRAALRWSIESGDLNSGLRLGDALRLFWFTRGHLAEGRVYLHELLALADESTEPTLRARVLDAAGFLERYQGDYAAARKFIEQALAIRRGLGDQHGTADSLSNLGYVALHEARQSTARALYEEALQIYRDLANAQGIADSVSHLGLLAMYEGRIEAARARHEETLVLWRSVGDQFGIGWALSNLGAVAVLEGHLGRAQSLLTESARLNADLHSSWGVACSLEGLALLAAAQDQPARALRLAGAATALRAHAGTPLAAAGELHFKRQLEPSWAALDHDRAAHAYAEGEQLTLKGAVEYALDGASSATTNAAGELTEREAEVAQLVAQGLTNRAIAAHLIVGKRTVDTHVEHVMNKLGVRSRAQIAAWLSHQPSNKTAGASPSG